MKPRCDCTTYCKGYTPETGECQGLPIPEALRAKPSDTPRTDAQYKHPASPTWEVAYEGMTLLARQLERSLSDEIRDAGALANAAGKAFDKGLDNDELRAALSAWAQREAPK